jgi:hypothetical protein
MIHNLQSGHVHSNMSLVDIDLLFDRRQFSHEGNADRRFIPGKVVSRSPSDLTAL